MWSRSSRGRRIQRPLTCEHGVVGFPTALIGRDAALDEVLDLLDEHRLVSLVGTGGIGKTRLAGEVLAHPRISEQRPVLTVELAAAAPDTDLRYLVAGQLDVDSIDALLLRAEEDPPVLLLDNCETALDRARDLAEELLERSSALTLLVTSRSPLHVSAERVVSVEPLAGPSDDDEDAAMILATPAAQLFVDRARAAGARWLDDESVATDLGQLLRRLDGLPLAIELAAARSRLVTPVEMLGLLDDQLDILSRSGPGDGRHQSLRAAIRTSYDRLDEPARAALRYLSAIPGSFDRALAERILGYSPAEALDALAALDEASLLATRIGPTGQSEFHLYDAIRAFGNEQLDGSGEVADATSRYVDGVAAAADEFVVAAMEAYTPEVLDRIRASLTHLTTSIGWCIQHDPSPERAYRMFLPLYGPAGARPEIADLAARARERWSDAAPLQAEAWAIMATSLFLNGAWEDGRRLAAEALDHPDATDLARLSAHRALGFIAATTDDDSTAATHLAAAVRLAGDVSESHARELRISKAAVTVDPGRSADVLSELAAIGVDAARHDELVTVVWASATAAFHQMLAGDGDAAVRSVDSAVDVAESAGLPWAVTTAHRARGAVQAWTGDLPAAATSYLAGLEAADAVGDLEGIAMLLTSAAGAAAHAGQDQLAGDLWRAIPPAQGRSVLRSIFHEDEDALRERLGPPGDLATTSSLRRARGLLSEVAAGAESRSEPAVAADTDAASPDRIRFDDCELDLAMMELRRGGERVAMEPQVFDVLAYLVQNRGAVVTKEQILDDVWGDRFVSLSALSTRISAARRATGDDGRTQRVIRTVHGKGFAFVAEVEGD